LDGFAGKLKDYRGLAAGDAKKENEAVESWGRKVAWSFVMTEEVQK
jgi:hypothetical protein